MPSIDDSGFVKKGTVSAGVQHRYSGTAGRTENCQIGVFAAYASSRDRALADREFYLPKSWTDDVECCRKARIPEERGFATKRELARCTTPILGRRGTHRGAAGSGCSRATCVSAVELQVNNELNLPESRTDELERCGKVSPKSAASPRNGPASPMFPRSAYGRVQRFRRFREKTGPGRTVDALDQVIVLQVSRVPEVRPRLDQVYEPRQL